MSIHEEIAHLERAYRQLDTAHRQPANPELYYVPSETEWQLRLSRLRDKITWLKVLANRREPRLVPGCGGTETPILAKNGRKYLWCWDANRTGTFPGDHVYVDMTTDMAITPEEHQQIFG